MLRFYKFFLIFSICFLLKNSLVFSQQKDSLLLAYQDTLLNLFNQIKIDTPDDIKESINNEIVKLFSIITRQPESLNFPFDTLKMVYKEKSSDNSFRIYNWNLNYNNNTYKYFGFIQHISKDKKLTSWQLFDRSDEIENPDNLELNPQKWYGALYYKIIPFKFSKRMNFILFGWDGNNDFSKKKIIEVLWFDKNGKPKFGAPVFQNEKSLKKRIVFEFAARATFTLVYDDKLKTIVFDALSPSDPIMKGKYEYYAPDGTYEAYILKKGLWNFQAQYDARNPEKKRKKSQR